MQSDSVEAKQKLYNEFFTIKHELHVNVKLMADDFSVPSQEELVAAMPYPFRMASEMSELEAKALRPLRTLGEHAKELLNYLNQQSKKIDLMMSYILQQQDDPQERLLSTEFGGGGISVASLEPMPVGTVCQLKIFIEEEASAVFCFGEIISCNPKEDGYHSAIVFSSITEQDQELLVRSSLHLQTKQLKKQHQGSTG